MLDSLADHRVFNAQFYALRLLRDRRAVDLERALLTLASHEVDGLGHVFIYTDAALRLMRRAGAVLRREVLLDVMEFLGRRATFEPPATLRPARSREPAYRAALACVGLLGHNVIYSRSLELRREELPAEVFDHALAQLERNIGGSEGAFTVDDMKAIGPAPDERRPKTALVEAVASGDERATVALTRGYLASKDVKAERVWEALVLAFALIDTHQPHYLIFPDSAWLAADLLGGDAAELAASTVAREAARAAKRFGMSRRF
jgi:hypothetical protein